MEMWEKIQERRKQYRRMEPGEELVANLAVSEKQNAEGERGNGVR